MEDALGSVQSVLVLGGGSDIGLATARALVRGRARRVVLAARRPQRLEAAATELRGLGATDVSLVDFDADDLERHPAVVDDAFGRLGDVDVVVVAFGVLGDAEEMATDTSAALRLMQTNVMGAVSVTLLCATKLRAQGHGTLVVLSSVAGERVRRSNFVYGASKAALDGLAQGLGDALGGSGARVLVVRPGFVRSKMTAGLEPAPLSTTPEAVADAIVGGLRRGAHTVWAPPAMRWVMAGLRHLPRPVFRRLKV